MTQMRILAIETASEACSVALFDDAGDALTRIAHEHRVLGRGHAEALVPMIAELPDKGRADRILVSLGPGSFTGVRIGIATARALGFAWGAEVLGYPTLTLIAGMARTQSNKEAITVCINGGHGEYFVQNFSGADAQDDVQSLTPDDAAHAARHDLIAGNRAKELAARIGRVVEPLDLLPDAGEIATLPDYLLSDAVVPIYGRGPDATPQKVRTA